MERRTFIKTGLAAAALVWTSGAAGLVRPLAAGSGPAGEDFTRELPVPPLLENLDNAPDSVRVALRVQQGTREFFPGRATQTLGYNGDYLGPTIRVRQGQRFRASVHNTLSQTTTLHWHGLHVPAQWDGGPRQPIPAGARWNPDFTIKQQAATLWYHPHAMGLTGEQVYRGLAGLFLIEDEVSDRLDLPRTYGKDDIPLIFQDRRFFENGQFAYVQNRMDIVTGVIGNFLLVNGVIQPTLKVHAGPVRLRLLNGSNSALYRIAFADGQRFGVIASDGGFLERPVTLSSLVLSAGERAEVVVDFTGRSPGQQVSLLVDQYNGTRFEALRIRVDRAAETKVKLPAVLRPFDRIPASEATVRRSFLMETMGMGGTLSINGKKMDLNRIDERVSLGATEIWEITNRTAMMMSGPHSMHLHDVQFLILDRDGKAPPPHEQGRKDTVLVMPGETVRIISRFLDYTGVYMYHCHLLEHEDDGMMGQFEVVQP
ncbi:MAG: multicopper oxidase domain-containing protein [Thermodesulfobacteriota bacterium]